jgi:hypothetical protein
MRLRSALVVIMVLLAVPAVYSVCHPRGGSIDPVAMSLRLAFTGTIAAGYYAASIALRRWMGAEREWSERTAVVVGGKNGAGRFRVSGVDRASRMETTEFIDADSPERARIKVDLKGVEVATIERV